VLVGRLEGDAGEVGGRDDGRDVADGEALVGGVEEPSGARDDASRKESDDTHSDVQVWPVGFVSRMTSVWS
jgi:hypothetical protein